MAEDRDFDYVVGKLPRKNKDGKDITGDRIGKGGRRRDDGTLSSMAYDLEVVGEDPTRITPSKPRVIYKREIVEVQPEVVRYEDLPIGGQILVDCVDQIVGSLAEYATYRITKGIENRLEKRRRKKEERIAEQREIQRQLRAKREARLRAEKCTKEHSAPKTGIDQSRLDVPDEFEAAYENYSINMTSEEAQKELLDAYILYVISAKKIWKVSHARIVDSQENIINGRDMIEKLSNPALLGSINEILSKNPTLLEEWQTMALVGILGRELESDSQFIPIESGDIKRALLEGKC